MARSLPRIGSFRFCEFDDQFVRLHFNPDHVFVDELPIVQGGGFTNVAPNGFDDEVLRPLSPEFD